MDNSAPGVFGITRSEDTSVFLKTCTFVLVSRITTPDSPTKFAFRCFVTKTTAPKSSHASFSFLSRSDIPSTCSSSVVVFFDEEETFFFCSFLLSSNSFAAYSLHSFLTLFKDSHVNVFGVSFPRPLPKRPSPPTFVLTNFFHPLLEYSSLSAFANRLRRSSFLCKSPSLSSLNLLLVLVSLLLPVDLRVVDSNINSFFSGSFVLVTSSTRPISLLFRWNKSRITSTDSTRLSARVFFEAPPPPFANAQLFLLSGGVFARVSTSSSSANADEYTHLSSGHDGAGVDIRRVFLSPKVPVSPPKARRPLFLDESIIRESNRAIILD